MLRLLLLSPSNRHFLRRIALNNMSATSKTINRVEKSTVLDFLAKNSFEQFYVEYDGFLANHLAHAAIALFEIGDDEEHFKSYLDHYRERLEPPDGPAANSRREVANVKEEPIEALLGERRGFYRILQHFTALLKGKYGGSVDDLIREEFAKLSPGLIAAALHPVIHMGYGLSMGDEAFSKTMVLEGMAYLHYAYTPMVLQNPPDISKFGHGSKDVLEVIEELRQDDELFEYMKEDCVNKMKSLEDERAVFQGSVMSVFDHGDKLMEYAHRIKVPKFDSVDQLMRWVVDQTIKVYVGSAARNDFFLLHGVTASWSLKQILPKLRAEDQTAAVSTFLCGLMAVYLGQGRPMVKQELIDGPDVGKISWEDLKERLLAIKVSKVDEHDFKLFHVCHDQWERYKDKEMEPVYKRAVLNNLEHPLRFRRDDD